MALFFTIASLCLTFNAAGSQQPATPSEAACNLPLGIASGKFRMDQFLFHSYYSFETLPINAKLNSPGGYRAKKEDTLVEKFVGIKFDNETIVTGVAMQGFGDPDIKEWVTQYYVRFTRQQSESEVIFISDSNGRPKLFQGNNDSDTIARNNFAPENVKQFDILPNDFHSNVAFRFELYGCKMKRSVDLYFRWKNEHCTLEMLMDKKSDGFKLIEEKLANEQRQISRLPGVQVVKLEQLRPGSLIVGFKVGVQDSQVKQMTAGAKKLLKSFSKFDSNYFSLRDPKGSPSCNMPNISLPDLSHNPDIALRIQRSSSYIVEASITSQTKQKGLVTWRIAQLQNSQRAHVDRKGVFKSISISTEEVVLGNTTLRKEILNHTLQYGIYYIEVMVEIKNFTGCINYNYGFLRVKETPLHVVVSTNPSLDSILKGYHRYLELDASGSFDPDVKRPGESGLKYTWLCARKKETFGNTALLPIVVPLGKWNGKGCYGSGPGKLNFTGPHAKLFLDQMESNKSYVFQIIVEKDLRRKSVSYEFALRASNSFILKIRCKRNCKQKVNPKEKMAFEGVCKGEACEQKNTQFSWTLFLKKGNGRFQPVEIKNNRDPSLLEIDGHVLAEGEEYELQLRGNLTETIKSFTTHYFITNESPSGGNCTADKFEGQVLVTNFTFSCFSWVDRDSDLIYQFGYKSSGGVYEILQESSLPYLRTNKLPLGDSETENTVQVDIYVKDKWGGFGVKSVKVKVFSSRTINATTLYQYTMGNESEVAKLLKSKDGGKNAMRLANTLLSVMSGTSDKELKKEDKIKFKDEMIKHSSKVKVDDLQGIILVTSVVASATDKSEELSEESQWNSVDVLENMANMFQNISVGSSEKDPTGIKKAGNNLLVGIGNVLDANAAKAETQTQTDNEREETTEESSTANVTKTKFLAQKAFVLISKVGDSMLSSQEVGDEPVEVETKVIAMRLDRQPPSAISDKPAKIKDSKVTFPPPDELLGSQAKDMAYVDTQILSLKHNPFSWDKTAKTVNSAVISIDLKSDKGKVLEVSGLSREIELYIKTNRPQQSQVPLHSFVKPSVNGSMQYHRVVISNEGMVISLKVVPSNGSKLEVYFRHLRRPTITSYDFMAEVPDFTSCKRRAQKFRKASYPAGHDGYFNCTRDPYLLTLSSDVTGHIGLHYIGVRLPGSSDDSKEGKRSRRSCSENGRQKRSEICVEFKDPPTTPPPTPRVIVPEYDPSTDVNYTLSISMGACLYWSERQEKWTSEGCRVGPNSANGSVQCLCNHLSSFGGDFLVAPNPIDFDQVWDAFSNILETKNFVVLATVSAMLGLYVIAVVFARRADRGDSQKVTQVIPLGDVNPDNHCYELTIYTGIWRRSGTSANVAIVIYGDDRDTDTIPLNCSTMCNKKLFARGSVNTFMLSLKESLGDISHIKIWHDNSGENPQWFINKIVIRDAKTDATWYFVCNRWLAAEREDGKIERVLYVSSTNEINSFKNKFYSRVSAGLGDGHVWLSVITRPPTSPFTRVQRVSCCLSVLMSAMVTNAMFYQFGAKDTSNAFQLGPFVLSWRQIIIGMQSAILVFPINVLIVFLFRNSRRKDEVTQAYDINSDGFTENETRQSGCVLSRFFVYVAWALCILTSLTSAAFTVFYSMMWGTEVSNKWLTSILVSFTQDVLFIQPVKVIIVASLLALIIKKAPEDDSVKEHHKSVAHSKLKGESHKPLKPDKHQLERFREYRVRVMFMARVLFELAFYLIFAWALMVICYGRRDTGHYWMTNGINKLLPKFNKTRDTDTFWAWTKKYLVPAVYEVRWYNGQPFEYKEGFISDLSGYLIGMPRFRQLRVKPGPCPIAPRFPEFRETLHPCLPPYSMSNEDQTPYSMPKWREIPTNKTLLLSEFALRRICPRPWRYKTAGQLHSLPLQGLRALYGGGGFVADLGYTKASALRVIENLKNSSWIDERTRAVFIEFMIFDSSTNLFSAVSYIYEALPLGGAATFKKISTMSLYGVKSAGARSIGGVCELIVLLMVFYFIIAEAVKIWKEKCFYFKSAWAYVEMAQILSATATVVLSIFRRYHTTKLVNRIRANPFETSSFHYAVLWSDLENALMAVLVFILTVKILKVLKFNEHISSLAASMARCRNKIVSYSAVFMVAFLAFMQVALLVFGSTTRAYSSVSEVFRTQFGMFIGGDTDYLELKRANKIIGPIYFFLFMTTMACILINMFLAILNESYREVRIHPGQDTEEYKMLGVFLDYAKNAMGKKATSLRNTKFFPRRDGYGVKNQQTKSKEKLEDYPKYTPINWSAYDYLSPLESDEASIERSFFKDIKKNLRNISSELKDISLLHRSRRYEVQEVQKKFDTQDQKFDKDLRTPCRGLGIEKVSSKCSLLSLSESTMYIDRFRKGRDSVRKLLSNEDTSDVEDAEWDDGTSYAESMRTFFGNSETIYDPLKDPFSESEDGYVIDRESYI